MRYSILVYGRSAEDLLRLSVEADRLGFDGLWLGEHLLEPAVTNSAHPPGGTSPITIPIQGAQFPLIHYDPFIALGAIAQTTTHLNLATGIALLAARHPLLGARAAMSMQAFSGGRFTFGVGSGWLKEEFDAIGIDFASRVGRLEEAIDICRAAFAGGNFSYRGKYFDFDDLMISPTPISIPIVLGGNAPPALRRAARYGDGWFISGSKWRPEDLLGFRDTIEGFRALEGKTGPFRIYGRYELTGEADIDRYQAEGIEDLLLRADQVWPDGIPFDERCAVLAQIAAELDIEPHGAS